MFDTVMCAYGMHLRSWKCTAGQFIESWNMVKTVISILSSSALVIVIDALSVSNNKTQESPKLLLEALKDRKIW